MNVLERALVDTPRLTDGRVCWSKEGRESARKSEKGNPRTEFIGPYLIEGIYPRRATRDTTIKILA